MGNLRRMSAWLCTSPDQSVSGSTPAGRGLRLILAASMLAALAGCATLPDGTATPSLARLSPEELARLSPTAEKLAPADLLAMARAGASAEAIIARLRTAGARFDLTPQQVVDLHAGGLPLAVLEAIHADREKALRNDLTEMLVERDRQCAGELEAERQRARLRSDPLCAGMPWGFYGPSPYWRYRR
ncbi:hypothetical protein [Rhodocyclus tenuis]|uniref:Uncharacterized protein n=2 Tax=Rhodocyclus tenuis TaxID=1066 RepID=A0A840GAB0_RHOTE|nr:hypothetical protein [Rhodocyclus tenuis]MBB4247840.1 hypothetical protein [Rhodocyclus tenuis]